MTVKHRNLYLYLTLVCFLGIIVIFIIDGYMGIHDTLSITAREYPQKIEADQWSQQARNGYIPTVNVEWGGKAAFRYEVDNHQFSSYTADITVSVWHSQAKVADLVAQPMSVASFERGQLEWVVDTAELLPKSALPAQGYQYTVIIKRGEIERKVIVDISPTPYTPTVVPAPPG
jgi:hypothetical protein